MQRYSAPEQHQKKTRTDADSNPEPRMHGFLHVLVIATNFVRLVPDHRDRVRRTDLPPIGDNHEQERAVNYALNLVSPFVSVIFLISPLRQKLRDGSNKPSPGEAGWSPRLPVRCAFGRQNATIRYL